jgi:hypothetical protein
VLHQVSLEIFGILRNQESVVAVPEELFGFGFIVCFAVGVGSPAQRRGVTDESS